MNKNGNLNPKRNTFWGIYVFLFVLLGVSMACSLPIFGSKQSNEPEAIATATIQATLTATPRLLPPSLAEVEPLAGAELPLSGEITFYFSQPMDKTSVEAALGGSMIHAFSSVWDDTATLRLVPDQRLQPGENIQITLDNTARSAEGLPMLEPIEVHYHTTDSLQVTQAIPKNGTDDVNPSSAIVAAFNQPMVPLGADPKSLDSAFTLKPQAEGKGEWLNTSTYIFYPSPPLSGGVEYEVILNEGLTSVMGATLAEVSSWKFRTTSPKLIEFEPDAEQPVPIDAEFTLTFNQPMNTQSVQDNFALLAPDGKQVDVKVSWDDSMTVFTFKVLTDLKRNTNYIVFLPAKTESKGGTPLGKDVSVVVMTYPELYVVNTTPKRNGVINPVYSSVSFQLSAPVPDEDLSDYVTVEPPVEEQYVHYSDYEGVLRINGRFEPNTKYLVTLSPHLTDKWGSELGVSFEFPFRTSSLRPDIMIYTGSNTMFATPEEAAVGAQVTNIFNLSLTRGSIAVPDFIKMFSDDGYNFMKTYTSADQITWSQRLDIPRDQTQNVMLPLAPGGGSLTPGLYYLRLNLDQNYINQGPFLFVISNVQLTFKVSATDVLVWAVDVRTGEPITKKALTIYDESGAVLASGETDDEGIFRALIEPNDKYYRDVFALLGQPGEEDFSMAISSWDDGINSWDFGLSSNFEPPKTKAYIYTDRPIYRPGQTVYYRAVLRDAYNGRYKEPDLGIATVVIKGMGKELDRVSVPLSNYDTVSGKYTLPAEAKPGYYQILIEEADDSYLEFQVADYRKPEIKLDVNFEKGDIKAGENLMAEVKASYYFGAPAGNLPIRWALYAKRTRLYLPGYQVGPVDTSWQRSFIMPDFAMPLGEEITSGEGTIHPDGTFSLDLPTEVSEHRQKYTLEITVEDESGLTVSKRAAAIVNPDDIYIGVRPDAWIGRANESMGFELLTVNWDKDPVGMQNLHAIFKKVTWEEKKKIFDGSITTTTLVPKYEFLDELDIRTDETAKANLSFIPPEPGAYQLDLTSLMPDNESAKTEVLIWVGGEGDVTWPRLPDSRLLLIADKESYVPGEVAEVFVPNPFDQQVQSLVTVERGIVLRHKIVTLAPGGETILVKLDESDAPNVYVSTTLFGWGENGKPEFRQGYTNLKVAPVKQTLHVDLVSEPEIASPGDEISFDLHVTDSEGTPVEGEFSLAVIDEAVLALADPNAPDITEAFYGNQPLGVRTNVSLVAYAGLIKQPPLGVGGGGGGEFSPSVVREHFPDTAYWNAALLTDENGIAKVKVKLPDSLTTWQVDLRGLTTDTRVGEAKKELITRKDLIVRPVAPRFFVAGDKVLLGAIINNTSDETIQMEVALQASSNITLEDPATQTQLVEVQSDEHRLVEWWAHVENGTEVDLVFSVKGIGVTTNKAYQDAARPVDGVIPVYAYTAPQSFATSGTLEDAGEKLELINLPRSFDPTDGGFKIELFPSLGATLLDGLKLLKNYPYLCTEQTISRFLPNLELLQMVQELGLDAAGLRQNLNVSIEKSIQVIQSRQNKDGGWGWWANSRSDPYLTAYVLFGLMRANDAGASVSNEDIQNGLNYLLPMAEIPADSALISFKSWQLDRLVFEQYVLSIAEMGDPESLERLYEINERLDPWAQAMLALAFENINKTSPKADSLLENLAASANRSATGAHWDLNLEEDSNGAYQRNMVTTLTNSAIVVYALALKDPGAAIIDDAVKYLIANRGSDGAWQSTYATSWTIMALTEVMKGTGELGGEYSYAAFMNNTKLLEGTAKGVEQLHPVAAEVSLKDLYAAYSNALSIQRDEGLGRLYYTASLLVKRPVEDVEPLSKGLTITRNYYPKNADCIEEACTPLEKFTVGEKVKVHLTLIVPNNMYNLIVEDTIPAGAEIQNLHLKTTEIGDIESLQMQPWSPRDINSHGWGWWYFSAPEIYKDHIAWAVDYLPAGTYELTYTIVGFQAGEYHVIPSHAWQFYFPDVEGASEGQMITIEPK